jgi:hypothetical protein
LRVEDARLVLAEADGVVEGDAESDAAFADGGNGADLRRRAMRDRCS